jgi:hypothetical protein
MRVLSDEQRGPILAGWRKACAHVAGGALGSTVSVLERCGALAALAAATAPLAVDDLARRTGLERGYAHLAAQLLATQALATTARIGTAAATVALTDEGRVWAAHAAAYDRFEDLLAQARALRAALAGDDGATPDVASPGATARATAALAAAPPELAERLRLHLRGPLVAAAVCGLARVRAFGRIARAPLGWCARDALGLPRRACDASVALLAEEGWLLRDDDLVRVTPEGLLGVRWMALYGYLVGYLGVLGRVPEMLGRERRAAAAPDGVKDDDDRALLLAGKAQVFARGGLREPLEDLVCATFDAEPLAAQPRLLLDLSAGDGSVLATLHEAIVRRTRRGPALREHPLTLVGLAGSRVAREQAAARLGQTDAGSVLLQMPFEDPAAIAAALARAGLDLRDALVIAKTCIHGRTLRGTYGVTLPARDAAPADTVFVAPDGALVAPRDLEDDLAAFFARWATWVGRHGMIAADAHTVPAPVAAESWPVNVVTHVLATHGYSAQYLVEADVFRRAARRGGFASRASRDLGTELVGATTMTLDHLVVAAGPAHDRH